MIDKQLVALRGFRRVLIDGNRLLLIRTFFSDLPLGLGDIAASLHDAVEMFESRRT